MILYWSIFIYASLGAMLEEASSRMASHRRRTDFWWLLIAVVMCAMIGLRWETGGDWFNYYRHVQLAHWNSLWTTIGRDPAFGLLVSAAAHGGGGMLLVTICSALIIVPCTVYFCRTQPRPWLCLAVLIPYFIIVVGMGYIRQAMAASLCLMAFLALERHANVRFVAWVIAAVLFHASAAMMLPIAFLTSNRNKVLAVLAGAILIGILYFSFLQDRADQFVDAYVGSNMDSTGAAIRILMTALPAAVFLIWKNRFDLPSQQARFWSLLCWGAIALVFALFLLPSSTAVDRIGLYFIPIQGFVWNRFPGVFPNRFQTRRVASLTILLGYALIFYVWATFATHAKYWSDYHFYFFSDDQLCWRC